LSDAKNAACLCAMLFVWGCGGAAAPSAKAIARSPTPSVPTETHVLTTSALPPSGPRPPLSFPEISVVDLSSGIHVVTVVRPSQPLVDVRLVVGSGTASDGERVGRAAVTARTIADAARPVRATIDPKELMLSVKADVDHVVLGASLLPDALEPSLLALGAAASTTRFTPADEKKAARAVGADETAWLRSLDGAGERLIRRDLFVEPTGRHPYATVHPTGDDLAKIDAALVNECAHSSYVGENLTLVVVGPIAGIDVGAIAERAFAHIPTTRAVPVSIDDPMGRPRPLRIALVDDPKRTSVSIALGRLGPELADGDSVALRLFGRVILQRMKHGRDARFRLVSFRDGPGIALFEAEVTEANAAATLAELIAPDTTNEVSDVELGRARDALDDELRLAFDRPGFVADTLATFAALRVSPSTLEQASVESRMTARDRVAAVGRHMLEGDEVAIVIGDAKVLAKELAVLGEVDILDPGHELERSRTEPRHAPAKLSSDAKKGDDSKSEEPSTP
jgi:predicted Zn-dependent peptidase